jgi:two-component system OmpR family sensor kinase
MTRRIALAILFSAWAVVLVALVAIYFVTRQTVLAELDESIIMRASALPQLRGVTQESGLAVLPAGDRYVILNEVGQVLVRPEAQASTGVSPVVTSRKFVSVAGGGRLRSITLTFDLPALAREPRRQATIVYSAPADALDNLLSRMAYVLAAVGLGGAILIGAVALHVSRAALRPLRDTADVIGAIDEKKLDRRVQATELPSELRPMAERLNEMLARLELEFSQRKQFLADTAHELRTPVAAILTHLEVTLRRPREAAELAEALRTSLSDVQLLRRLVDALLEQVRSDRPLAAAQITRVDISSLLEQCATLADSLASAKSVRITRDFSSGLRCYTQPVALQSIVTNLLANAVQYSPTGSSVEFAARLVDGKLDLSVRDHGPGIAATVLPHIFQPFYRADGSHSSADGHLGLGLFLVQSHAKSMGGRCEVDSTVGEGTTFRVKLPALSPSPASISQLKVEQDSAASEIIQGSKVAIGS